MTGRLGDWALGDWANLGEGRTGDFRALVPPMNRASERARKNSSLFRQTSWAINQLGERATSNSYFQGRTMGGARASRSQDRGQRSRSQGVKGGRTRRGRLDSLDLCIGFPSRAGKVPLPL